MRRTAGLGLGLLACGGATSASPPGPSNVDPVADAALDAAADSAPDAAPAAHVWHVAAEAPRLPADGSSRHPDPTFDGAFARAVAGDVIVAGPGRYPTWAGPPPAGVEIEGTSTAEVRVAGPLTLAVDGLLLRNFTVTGGLRITRPIRLEGLRIEGGGAIAVRVELTEGTFAATDLAIVDSAGQGFWQSGGTAELTGLSVDGAVGSAVRLPGTTATAAGVSIAHVTWDAGEIRAHGLEVEGGTARLHGVVVQDVADRAVRLVNGAHVEASTLTVGPNVGDGMSVLSQAVAVVSDLTVTGARGVGVGVIEAELTLSDSHVAGGGQAGLLLTKATVALRRVAVANGPQRGIAMLQSKGTLDEVDVSGMENVGIQITEAAGDITIVVGHLSYNAAAGLAIIGPVGGSPGTRVTVRDVTVTGTRAGEGDAAEGIHLYRSTADVTGIVAQNNAGSGVLFEEALGGTISGCQVEDSGRAGIASVSPRGPIEVADNTTTRSTGAGLLFLGGTASLRGNVATDTLPADDGTADGLEALNGATLTLRGDRFIGNGGNGVFVFGRSTMTAVDLTAQSNGGFGLYVDCGGSAAALSGSRTMDGNERGERNPCP